MPISQGRGKAEVLFNQDDGHAAALEFQQHLANIIATSMGDAAATLVRPQIHHVDGGDVCRVQVDPAGFPVDAKVIIQKPGGPKDTRTEFYVRVANGTKALDVVEREKYIVQRWGKHS